jgi:hypothetical protein
MKIFGKQPVTISVTCSAEMRLPNTDIMFVLDTTGSMNDPIPGETERKMVALHRATKCFYEIVARVATTADCGPDPSGGLSDQVQVRFGFVPYATNVNVGRLLHNDWLENTADYQTRVLNTTPVYAWTTGTQSPTTWGAYDNPAAPPVAGSWSNLNADEGSFPSIRSSSPGNTINSSNCSSQSAPSPRIFPGTENNPVQTSAPAPVHPASAQVINFSQTHPHTYRRFRYEWNNSACRLRYNDDTFNRTRTGSSTTPVIWTLHQRLDSWTYRQAPIDVSGLKAGNWSWNAGTQAPLNRSATMSVRLSGSNGSVDIRVPAMRTLTWTGCIEERATERLTSVADYEDSDAMDLDIDLVPSAGVAGSRWRPALRDAVFTRGSLTGNNTGETDDNFVLGELTTATSVSYDMPNFACPRAANKLQEWEAAAFEAYVDSLTPSGNTYHDIGMLWGTRLLSPTGLFRSENEFTPEGGEIERHLIFMTDGQTCTNAANYQAYGVAWYDRRQTDAGVAPPRGQSCSDASNSGGIITEQVDARFPAICTAARARNITVWVVYFGTTDTATQNRLKRCASNYNPITNTSDRFFLANNSAALLTSFRQIASQISQLRLTQ